MLNWLRNNLFNRWSFNLLIWHGLRMILRIGIIMLSNYINMPFIENTFSEGFSPIYLFLDPLPQVFIIFLPIIVFCLERKLEFRFTPKFFQNKFSFVLYILLAIPALIVEIFTLAIVWLFFATYFFDYIVMLFNPYDLKEYFISLFNTNSLLLFTIWVL